MWLERFGDLDHLAFYIFCAVAVVLSVLCLILLFLPCCVTAARGVSPGSSIDFYMALGGRLLVFTVLARGLDPAWLTARELDSICQVFPCALLLGLTMLIGGVFIKAASIQSFKWTKHVNALGVEWRPSIGMWLLILLIGVAAVTWSVAFTPTLQPGQVCGGVAQFEWQVGTSAWHGLLLLLSLFLVPLQCKASRHTPASPESTALTVVYGNMVLTVAAGLCVHFLYAGPPIVVYAITGGLTMWVVLFTDLMLLTGRVISARTYIEENLEGDERYDEIKLESGELPSLRALPEEEFPPKSLASSSCGSETASVTAETHSIGLDTLQSEPNQETFNY